MLNVIQLMDDEGLGHCKRMVTFAKLISKTGDKIVFLISDKKKYQAKILDHEELEFIEYDCSLDIEHTYSLVIKKRNNPNLRSWSIDTKRNCIETLKFIKDQGVRALARRSKEEFSPVHTHYLWDTLTTTM